MYRIAFLSLVATLAGCSFWGRSVLPQTPSSPQSLSPEQGEAAPELATAPLQDAGSAEKRGDEAEVTVPKIEVRKVVAPVDKKLLLGLDGWFAGIGEIEAAVRKWSLAMKRGEEIAPGDIAAVRARYEALHAARDSIAIPPAHREATEVIEAYDEAAGNALSLLSDPPTAAELSEAVQIFRGMTEQANAMNRILNEILY